MYYYVGDGDDDDDDDQCVVVDGVVFGSDFFEFSFSVFAPPTGENRCCCRCCACIHGDHWQQ